MRRKDVLFAALLFVGFFALYALTAQRGLGWGDSGEFQYRVLVCKDGLLGGCDSFATAHPLYVALARFVCATPWHVTLVSSFFGALALVGFWLCSRQKAWTVILGLSHALWWLSCVAEVYTMSLAFLAFETFFLLKFLASRRAVWILALALLNGLHLEVHNFALLAAPVYLAAFFYVLRPQGVGRTLRAFVACAVLWAVGAAFWLYALAVRGPRDVLVGSYGGKAFGLLPSNWTATGFNLALTALSFVVVALALFISRKSLPRLFGDANRAVADKFLWGLFVLHGLFFVRYFVIDQFTFVLPTLFFATLLVSRVELKSNRAGAFLAMQLLLPLLACQLLSSVAVPSWRARHKYRNEAQYFAWPWKCQDDSADRYAKEIGKPWNGYPDCN